MSDRIVSATEFARNLSRLLNEVRFRDVSLEVRRGREPMARVIPAGLPEGVPIDRLNALIARLPRLEADDADAFERDLADLDHGLSQADDPWGS